MKNKGFTLIELLAVIVILAIIALIATPIILGIIDDARKGAAERGAELIISNVELAYSTAYMLNEGNYPTLKQVSDNFKMDEAKMTYSDEGDSATIEVDDKNIVCTVSKGENNLSVECTPNADDTKKEKTSTTMTLSPKAA